MEIKTIVRAPRRRGAGSAQGEGMSAPAALLTTNPATPEPADTLLCINAEDVQEVLKEVAGVGVRIGVPVLEERLKDKAGQGPAEVLRLEVDPAAVTIGAELVEGLRKNPAVQERSGEKPEALAERCGQCTEAALMDQEAGRLDEAVVGGRGLLAAAQRTIGPQVEEALEFLLKVPNLRPDKRERLLWAKGQLDALDQRIKAQREEQAAKTRAATAAGAAAVAAAQRDLNRVEAMVNLQQGGSAEDVDPAVLEDALADAGEDEDDDRRGSSR